MPITVAATESQDERRSKAKNRRSIWATPIESSGSTWQGSTLQLEEVEPFTSRAIVYEIARRYRLEYCVRLPPRETMPAWEGACWCSDVAIGSFPYGPGPGDPYLPATLIHAFFSYHERNFEWISPIRAILPLEAENDLNRRCYVLALFELILHLGLDECHEAPLFAESCHRVPDLLNLAHKDMVDSLRRDSRELILNRLGGSDDWAIGESRSLTETKDIDLRLKYCGAA